MNHVFGERSPSPHPWVERKISSGTASRPDRKTQENLPNTPQNKRIIRNHRGNRPRSLFSFCTVRLVGTWRRTPPAFLHSWRCPRQYRQVCTKGPGSDRHQRVLQITIFPALSFQCRIRSKQSAVSPGRVELRSKLLEDGCWLLLTEVRKATPPGLLMSRRHCATGEMSPARLTASLVTCGKNCSVSRLCGVRSRNTHGSFLNHAVSKPHVSEHPSWRRLWPPWPKWRRRRHLQASLPPT